MNDRLIPLSEPSFQGNEWAYVKECIDEEWVSSAGAFVRRFEDAIAEFTGARRAVACVNGTAALYIALQLAGVERGDEVIVPTLTFIAPVNAVRYVDGEPVFMDCDDHYTLDSEKTIRFIMNETVFRNGFTFNKKTGKRISAVIPVHVFGNAAYLDDLYTVCRERNIKIIEDAAESLGTFYTSGTFMNKHTGAVGDIGCLSFNGNKIITCGGGGMILAHNDAYADRAKYLTTQAKDDVVRYIHNEIGYNFRLSNLQAALGVAQLEQLPKYLETKKRNYDEYKKNIADIPGLRLAEVPGYASNNHWMYALQIEESVYGKNREKLMAYLSGNNIESRPVWHLNHMQKPFLDCQKVNIEKALVLLDITLNIPCSVNLTNEEMNRVVTCLKNA